MTVNVKVVVVEPPEFVAVMVYVVAALISPGVPEMVPVAGSNTKPPGKLGLMLYVLTRPPLLVGDTGVID